ncbi:SdpI family protein [Blautia schinkii]|nr:SdpI family protein [Blautia schinkii]
MGFWIFMLIMDLLLPFTMIGFGRYFIKKAPKEINAVFGYRTAMSMKNRETWEFAHKYCGKIWYVCGLSLLPITVLCLLLIIGKSKDYVGTVGGIICGAQLILLVGSILPTEIALKKTFDKNGMWR